MSGIILLPSLLKLFRSGFVLAQLDEASTRNVELFDYVAMLLPAPGRDNVKRRPHNAPPLLDYTCQLIRLVCTESQLFGLLTN